MDSSPVKEETCADNGGVNFLLSDVFTVFRNYSYKGEQAMSVTTFYYSVLL